jgi:hypothetical protein
VRLPETEGAQRARPEGKSCAGRVGGDAFVAGDGVEQLPDRRARLGPPGEDFQQIATLALQKPLDAGQLCRPRQRDPALAGGVGDDDALCCPPQLQLRRLCRLLAVPPKDIVNT